MNQMNYCELIDNFGMEDLYSETLDGPILLRPDINVPVNEGTGKISMTQPNLRLVYTAPVIEKCAEISPHGVYIVAHNGRMGDKDFVDFSNHASVLNTLMRKTTLHHIKIVNGINYFNEYLEKTLLDSQQGEAYLIENIRMFDFETNYNPESEQCVKATKFFKKMGVSACVHEGGPLAHRKHWSVMEEPQIAKTFIGPNTAEEVKLNQQVAEDPGMKAVIVGGAKPKLSDLYNILDKDNWDAYFVGMTAQYFLRINGYDLGEDNNKFVENRIEKRFKESDIEKIRILNKKHDIKVPEDFVVMDGLEQRQIPLEELPNTEGIIVDIGDNTVGSYADRINSGMYEWKVNAGSAGVYELNHNNGAELIWRIAGPKTLVLGGDTIESTQRSGRCRAIESLRTKIELMGGSALHAWAGKRYYSFDNIIEKQMR